MNDDVPANGGLEDGGDMGARMTIEDAKQYLRKRGLHCAELTNGLMVMKGQTKIGVAPIDLPSFGRTVPSLTVAKLADDAMSASQ